MSSIDSTHPDDVIPGVIHAVKPVPSPGEPINSFFKAEQRLAQLIRVIMVTTSLALGILMAAQVVMRYVLESPFLGIEELAPMLALWAYFMGMVYATREREHISGGIITLIVKSPKAISAIRLLGTLACIVVVCIFGYYAWKFSIFNFNLGRKSMYMRLPKYIWDFSMVAGFILMGFYYSLQAVAEIRHFPKNMKSRQVKTS